MKTILCYGDSNTWGYNPTTGERYDHKTRWPMVLQRLLNAGAGEDEGRYWIIEEGLCGRTSCREDPVEGDKNGLRQLPPILESHSPLDMVALMLGTNDLKTRYNPCAYDIAAGVNRLVRAIKDSGAGPGNTAPRVLVICPPPTVDAPVFKNIFGDCVELSTKLSGFFRQFAQESGAEFLDAGKVIRSSKVDGIHFDPEEHYKLAAAVAEILGRMESAL
ncbi:MAG: SGNH/GDSL hydrolase family protein [Spirochaetaceae bacterium]|jgi:lysophospholipase L1-like esterase|nr:SGNH/GDSL hydrolase family protein [Spirochaetaceae bacterium]